MIAAPIRIGPRGISLVEHDRDADIEREAIEAEGSTPAERRIQAERDRLRARRQAQRLVQAEERGVVTTPAIETLRDRLAKPAAAVRWRIEGWQPADSRVILSAQSKTGKTTLANAILRSLVDGDPFLGVAAVAPIVGTVCLIDTEMSPRQLDAWLRDQGIRQDDRVLVVALRGAVSAFDLLDPTTRMLWAARLRAHRVVYLILDCFRPVLDALGLEESHEAGRLLVAFDALLAEAQIPDALIVHHMGHGNERSRGDSRLRDWPDVEWRLVRQEDDHNRYLAAFGRDVDIAESRLDYDATTRRVILAGGSRRDARLDAALLVVSDMLRESPGLSGRAIKKLLADSDLGRNTIDAALALGVREHRLIVDKGPNNGRLYSVSRSVLQCPAGHSAESVSVCPAASIEAGHRDTQHDPSQRTVRSGGTGTPKSETGKPEQVGE